MDKVRGQPCDCKGVNDMKFKKKPIVIDATQWKNHGDHKAVRQYNGKFRAYQNADVCRVCKRPYNEHGLCATLEGDHVVYPDDWIITGVKGENYPCKPDIFDLTCDAIANIRGCEPK